MTHRCPWPDCSKEANRAQWGCSYHWFALPGEMRRARVDAQTRGDEKALQAVNEAIGKWLADRPTSKG